MRELGEKAEIDDTFPIELLLSTSQDLIPWFADFANYLASDIIPPNLSFHQRKKFMHDVQKLLWNDPYLYRSCADGIIQRSVLEVEMLSVLEACHSSPVDGHHSGIRTAQKIFQCGYYWLSIHQNAHEFTKACDRCKKTVLFRESKSSL